MNLPASCTGYTHAVFSCLDPQNTGRVTFEVPTIDVDGFDEDDEDDDGC